MSKKLRDQWAAAVIMHIPASADAEPVSVSYLSEMTGLKERQVREGVAELREMFKGQGEAPLVSGPRGYLFTFAGDKVEAFRQARARTAHTTILRLYRGAVQRYIASLPKRSAEARSTAKSFERVLEDLGDLIGAGTR